MILAGDVGGTKTELALVEVPRSRAPLREAKYASQNFPDLGTIIRAFLEADAHRLHIRRLLRGARARLRRTFHDHQPALDSR